MRRILALAGLIAFEVGTIVVLHALGRIEFMRIPWADLDTWIQVSPAEDTLAAILRLIALVAAYWLAASTLVYALARASRIPAAVRAVEWATLPAVRRLVDRVAAATLTAASFASPATAALAAEPPPVVYDVSEQGVPTPRGGIPSEESGNQSRYTPTPAGVPEEAAVPGPVAYRRQFAPNAAEYTVASGDNLWTISAAHLAAATEDTNPDEDAIAAYWRSVIEANRDRIRSGDPDLIYPGETIVLPPLDG